MDAVEFAIATRTNAAMSQKAMAVRMGVTERQIRNWEKRVAPIPKLAFEEYQRIEAETNIFLAWRNHNALTHTGAEKAETNGR